MTNYHVILQPEAEADLDEAFEYLQGAKKNLGFDLLEKLTDVIILLESNPFLFQKIDGEKRRAIIKRFKYNVIYKVKEQKVFIIAIIHGSKNPSWWQNRS